jgi:hypothetical protein
MTDQASRSREAAASRRLVVAWFTRRNYARHRALDPAGLPSTFDEWVAYAERNPWEPGSTQRIVIDPAQFGAWCRAASRQPDGAARTDFAQVVAEGASRRDWWRRRAGLAKR